MTAPMPYTLADVDGGAFTWDGDHEVLQRIRATVEALDAAQKRIAELEAELADAVDYGRGRHEAERRAEEAEQALATVTRERDEARASAGVLLDAFHGVLEALADSEGILEGITGDARGMAVAQLADNHRAVTAFTAALSSPASDWLAARDRRVAEMQREACARVVDRGVREDNGDTGCSNARFGNEVRATPLVTFKPEGET